MEVIYIILLFVAPGVAIKYIDEATKLRNKTKKKKDNIYENMFLICCLSVIVTLSSLTIINIGSLFLEYNPIATIDELFKRMNNIGFLLAYLVITIAMTLANWRLYVWLNKCMKKKKAAKVREEYGLEMKHEDHKTIWEGVFLKKEENEKGQIVSIFKDGAYITSGILDGRNTEDDEPKEFEIVRTCEIERILRADREKTEKDKRLHYIEKEYLDTETGFLFKFYKADHIFEHWDEINDEVRAQESD